MQLGQQLWTRPVSPHPDDDEFDNSTLDSVWYNYSVLAADYGTFSEGAVDAYDTTFNSGNALRVTVNSDKRRSWILLQPPNARQMYFGRLYTPPTNVLIVARLKFNQYYQSQIAEDRNIGLMLMADDAGKPSFENRVNNHLNLPGTGIVRGQYFKTSGGVDSDWATSTDVDSEGQALEYIAIHKIGTTYHGYVGTASGNWIWMGSFTHSMTVAHLGFYVNCSSGDKPGVGVMGIDFIRFYETANFLF